MINFRKTNRLTKYDYGQPGFYFVTVCTSQRKEYFGVAENGKMVLNDAGKMAENIWKRTPERYKNVQLDQFVIMPNHMHGIVVIQEVVQTPGLRPSLSQIVGSYKNVASKEIRSQGLKDFAWQPSFYDHVIRKDESLDKIREYIVNNRLKWELDRNNPSNLWM